MNSDSLNFILITPARNEQAFIELTIQSVIGQTVRPRKWLIVSDGSTDRTDEIVNHYAQQYDWIELFRMPERAERDFAGKADCFNTGYARCERLEFDIVGSLDADISFTNDYFEFLLEKLAEDPQLGIAGTPFSEGGATYDYRFSSTEHVSGACQLFRRECFETIGGYLPVKGGGIDVIAVLTARIKGWRTQTFTEKTCVHHRLMGSAKHKDRVVACFKLGEKDYCLGFHPLWQFFRSIYQMTKRPYLTGGCAVFLGYFTATIRGVKRPITSEVMNFQRRDQMQRLRRFLMGGARKRSALPSSNGDRELLNSVVKKRQMIIGLDSPILVTGGCGFVGSKVVESLLDRQFRDIRVLVRPSSDLRRLENILLNHKLAGNVRILKGNLLSREDCWCATRDIAVIYHLAAGTGQKSFPDAFTGSVVTTRNLLDACLQRGGLNRFVNVSSLAVYSNRNRPNGRLLDETCPSDENPHLRCEAYSYAKSRQDDLVLQYGKEHQIPYVLVRPGVVYGPGKTAINGRVGLGTFGVFLHLGGPNAVPLTFVDNCADAIVLSGLVGGIDGEVFNIIDDHSPTSADFLRLYKAHVRRFHSIPVPRPVSYLLCLLWERYSAWSKGQLPPVFNRRAWHAYWKGSVYTNRKLKMDLGWEQKVATKDGLTRFFES